MENHQEPGRCVNLFSAMLTDKLFDVLTSIYPITLELKLAIEASATPLSLPKYHMLLQPPKVAGHVYFIARGFAMSYIYLKERKQVECFCKEGQIILSARSFIEQVPSQEFIQLRDDSELLSLSYESTMQLLYKFPDANALFRIMMNRHYEHSRQRTRDLQNLNATELYLQLTETYPRIEQFVAQEDIASYLGITPQSLSRIRRARR